MIVSSNIRPHIINNDIYIKSGLYDICRNKAENPKIISDIVFHPGFNNRNTGKYTTICNECCLVYPKYKDEIQKIWVNKFPEYNIKMLNDIDNYILQTLQKSIVKINSSSGDNIYVGRINIVSDRIIYNYKNDGVYFPIVFDEGMKYVILNDIMFSNSKTKEYAIIVANYIYDLHSTK